MRAPIDNPSDEYDDDMISKSSTVPTWLCTDQALDIYVCTPHHTWEQLLDTKVKLMMSICC
jgi:phenylalanine-4-hydroxylase